MNISKIGSELQVVLDSISDGLFTVDKNFKITFFNKAAEKITLVKREDAIGYPCHQIFKTNICETNCALRKTLETGKPILNKTIWTIRGNGEKIPISISTAVLTDKNGQFVGGVETFRDLSEIETLKKELLDKYTVFDIVSKNKKIKEILSILPEIAESNSTLLIEGPNGSGKELFAKAIHNMSFRKNNPFVAVNLSALPDTLVESELFGYKKGAFTGANRDKPGKMAIANKGTLFIDEIGEISPALQVKLLRVIQEKEYEPLGGLNPEKSDVRFIFATNKNLAKLVTQDKFREDLFYRINVIRIELPPLNKRREDIPLLVNHFINHFNKMNNKDIKGIENDALNILMHYDFPGNIRELRNIIEHGFVLCKTGMIRIEHFPESILGKKYFQSHSLVGNDLESLEKQAILDTLKRNNNRKDLTAKELGINYTTLWRKLKRFNL